jgi:hypothetical protein
MVNLDDPKEFFRVIVGPNLQEFYANEGDLRVKSDSCWINELGMR